MAFDQTKPATTDNYTTAFVPGIQANFLALAMWLDSTLTSITGTIPTGAKRYNRTSGRIEEYSGSAWGNLTVNASSTDAINVANSYSAVNISLSGALGSAGGLQFTNSTSQDGYLQVDSGRTLRWRNGNSASPNWSVVTFETGDGVFHGGVLSTNSVQCGSAGAGYANLTPGAAGYAGYASFVGSNGVRAGYIGGAVNTGSQDTGGVNYVAGSHNFTGGATFNNGLLASAASFTSTVTVGVDGTNVLIKSPSFGGAIQLRSNSATTDRGISLGINDGSGTFTSYFRYLNSTNQWVSPVDIVAASFQGPLSGNATTATTALNAATQTAGNNSALIATTAFVQTAVASAPGLGVGQTWQNMTASRSFGASATNGTGKLISLNVSYSGSFVVGHVTCTLGSGPVLRSGFIGNPGGGVYVSAADFLVPAGETYTLNFVSVTGSVALVQWWELR